MTKSKLTPQQTKLIASAYSSTDTVEQAIELFTRDAKQWIQAIKTNKMLCIIVSVSSSGMSRKMKFHSFVPTKNRGYYRQYYSFLKALDYKPKEDGVINVSGCGMDMVFATCYNIAHDLQRMGFITKKQCAVIAQQTPTKL